MKWNERFSNSSYMFHFPFMRKVCQFFCSPSVKISFTEDGFIGFTVEDDEYKIAD